MKITPGNMAEPPNIWISRSETQAPIGPRGLDASRAIEWFHEGSLESYPNMPTVRRLPARKRIIPINSDVLRCKKALNLGERKELYFAFWVRVAISNAFSNSKPHRGVLELRRSYCYRLRVLGEYNLCQGGNRYNFERDTLPELPGYLLWSKV